MQKDKNQLLKFVCDFLPLIVFFTIYKLSNDNKIIQATIGLVISTFVGLTVSYLCTKKIAFMPLFSALILGVFGSLTVIFNDETFIKIKPTLMNLLFASILFYGFFQKKPLLKTLLGSAFEMNDESWLKLSKRWAIYFIFLAILNEIVWRNFSTDIWVKFKVFGILPIYIIFFALQFFPYINKSKRSNN